MRRLFRLYSTMFPSSRSCFQVRTLQSVVTMLVVFIITTLFLQASYGIGIARDSIYRAPDATSPEIPLDVFQVEAPLRKTYEGAACEKVILQHDFTASYGSPGVGMNMPS